MKRILMVIVVSLAGFGCTTTQQTTKQQPMKQGTEPVPAIYSYMTEMPLVKVLGDVQVIQDFENESLSVFRGEELTYVPRMTTWLDQYVDQGESESKSPVVLIGGTNILPFISLTTEQYESLGEEDKKLFDELVRYKRYTVTKLIFTYLEDLTPLQEKTYGVPTQPGGNDRSIPQNPQEPKKSGVRIRG